jgi:hypothetical protein
MKEWPGVGIVGGNMRGIITGRHLLTNAPTIIQEFGVIAYLRCLTMCVFGRRPTTFLEMVMRLPARRAQTLKPSA